jgi:hypothetical protein
MKGRATHLLVFIIGLVSGIWFISFGSISLGFEHFPGDLADARFNNYLLEHAYLFFSGQVQDYWSAPFMFPEQDVISYSDNLLGTAPFYSLFRLLGFDRLMAFQLWFLLMAALNYTAAFFFLRYLFKNSYAAACGAMIFAFSIALQSQMGHAQTFPRFCIPLAIWCALLFFKELRPRYFFLLLLCVVYQIYCGIYLGLILAVPVMVLFLLSILSRPVLYKLRLMDVRWVLKIAGSLLIAALALMPVMLPYIARSKQTGFYTFSQVVESLPTLVSYCYAWMGSVFWKFNDNIAPEYPAYWDHIIFPGGVAVLSCIILLIVTVIKLRKRSLIFQFDPQFRLFMGAGLICFLLYLRFGHLSLYWLVFKLPGFGSMRALQRIINIELIFFAGAAAYLVCMMTRKNDLKSALIFIAIATLIIIDNRVDPDYVHKEESKVALKRQESLILKIGDITNDQILSYEPDTIIGKQIYYQLDAMMASQTKGIRTLNGYSATSPAGYGPYWIRPDSASRMEWLNSKGRNDLKLLVIK